MLLTSLRLKNFRKFDEIDFVFSKQTVVTGPNGSGKTTLAEACALALGGRSFRTADPRDCIREGAPHAFLRAETTIDELEKASLTFGIDRAGQRKSTRDGAVVSRRALLELTSLVLCTQEDIEMPGGAPKRRRDLLDRAAMGQDRGYIETATRYIRFLRQKTALLRSGRQSGITHLNEAAVPVIDTIRRRRAAAAEALQSAFARIVAAAGLELSVEIRTPVEEPEEIRRRLTDRMSREFERGLPLYGPHLDDITLLLTGRAAKRASSGETAFGAFLLRLAETDLRTKAGWPPLFVADEIFSFMDAAHREQALRMVAALPFQTIITSQYNYEKESTGHGFDILTLG